MARDLDAQLLESVTVRRRRLRDALLWGRLRVRRSASENVARFLGGCVLAALICAGCVGWSFLSDALERSQRDMPGRAPVAPATGARR